MTDVQQPPCPHCGSVRTAPLPGTTERRACSNCNAPYGVEFARRKAAANAPRPADQVPGEAIAAEIPPGAIFGVALEDTRPDGTTPVEIRIECTPAALAEAEAAAADPAWKPTPQAARRAARFLLHALQQTRQQLRAARARLRELDV